MAVTRSRAQDRPEVRQVLTTRPTWRTRELALGLVAALLVVSGIAGRTWLQRRAPTGTPTARACDRTCSAKASSSKSTR